MPVKCAPNGAPPQETLNGFFMSVKNLEVVTLPKLTDTVLWKKYKRAFDLFVAGASVEETAIEAGLEPRIVAGWAENYWSEQRKIQVADAAKEVIEFNRGRVAGILNDVLEVVEKQVTHLKQADTQLSPRDIKLLAETAKNLQSLVTEDEKQTQSADKFVEIVKTATIQSVSDIAKLLQAADPDIDYSNIVIE